MKISAILILTTVLVILGFLIAFNFTMKQEDIYEKSKGQFRSMDFTALKGVEKIRFKLADGSRVKIVQGPKEGIWVSKRMRDNVEFNIADHTLTLNLSNEHTHTEYSTWNVDMVIITKHLKALDIHSFYDEPSKFTANSEGTCFADVYGYRSGQFNLKIGEYVHATLNNMQIDTLKADIGEINKKAELMLFSGMKVNVAQINIPGNGKLSLFNSTVVKTSYNLSDAATVSIDGKVVKND